MDSQQVGLSLTPGERVTVETPAQQRRGGGLAGATIFIDARSADRTGLENLKRLIMTLDATIEERSIGAIGDARRRNPALCG